MKACLGYRSVRNVRWAVEKMPAQKGMICDKVRDHCGDVEILLSSRGAREENFKGYYKGVRPSDIYVYVYIGPKAQSEDMK